MNYVFLLHQDRGCIGLSWGDAFQMKHERPYNVFDATLPYRVEIMVYFS
jgi:hypothetical protein